MELAAEMHDYIKEDLVHLFPSLKVPASAASTAANAAIAIAPVVAAAAVTAGACCYSICCYCCSCWSQTAWLAHNAVAHQCSCRASYSLFAQHVPHAPFCSGRKCRNAAGAALVFWQSTSGRQTAAHHRSMFLTPLLPTSSCMTADMSHPKCTDTVQSIVWMAMMSMLIVPMTIIIMMVLISYAMLVSDMKPWMPNYPAGFGSLLQGD